MNGKSKAMFIVMTMIISMSMISMLRTPVYADHTPEVTLSPEYSRGVYPEWKEFEVYNNGPDEIVIVSITHPEDFKPVEYSFPEGWTATYYPLLRQVVFESTDYDNYYIGDGDYEDFEICFGDGPTAEGAYEFIVSTTDIWQEAYTVYKYQYIDTTPPEVEIIYPLEGAVIRGPGIWINATAEDTGSTQSDIMRVQLFIDNKFVGAMKYDLDRDVYYWYNDTLSKGELLWYSARAQAIDNAWNVGWSDYVSFFWYVTWGISISPTSGPVGTTVTVTGVGFTPNSQVDITFYNTIDHGVVATALTTEQTFFETSFTVPETPGGLYTVNATDTEGLSDAKTFEVVPWITISPTSGTVGTWIRVSGTGFPNDTQVTIWWGGYAWNRLDFTSKVYLTWNGSWTYRIETVGTDKNVAGVPTNSKGSFTISFPIPESWGGYHPIWAQWTEEVDEETIVRKAFQEQIFRVLPSIETDPSSGVSGQYVHLKGTGWAYWGSYEMWNDKNANLEWDMCEQGFRYESEGVRLVVDFGPNQRYIDESHFILNGEADLAWFNNMYDPVTLDARGTIIYNDTQHNVIGTTGSPFLQVPFLQPGDYDVTGYRFIKWERMLDIHPGREPQEEILLFENNHIYSYVESASTTFTVEPLQIDDSEILNRLDELEATIIGVIEDAEGNILAVIETNMGTITARFDQIDAKLVSIQDDIATIDTKVGQIQVKVEDINAEIVAIKGDIATIKTDIGDIEVKLDDIQAKLVSIQGDIATVNSTLGEIETKIDNLGAVSIEEIKGDITTIKSDIGTIQEDISDINGEIVAVNEEMVTISTDIGDAEASLSDINAKIKVNKDNIATIQTDIGTIKGKLTSIEGDVATIETDIGTIKTSAESIETQAESIKTDTSLQPATVALSLIAALSAIAAAVMVLRKVYVK